jgi:mevalonate kinase
MTVDDFQSRGNEFINLVQMNRHLPHAVCRMSHPSLNFICSVVHDVGHGAAAAKLTGAGGGGCTMTLLQPHAESTFSYKIQIAVQKFCPVSRCL